MATFIPNITDVFPKPALAETDFNFVDKVLQRKQGLYQQGLEKVKNSYDSVLYAPISDKENFPIRDQYITQAKENLKALSSSDFSLPENIQAAQNVFSPFWTDEFIIKDSSLTRWYESQNQKLSSWKNSSDPKTREQYSGITSMYLNNGLDQLKNAGRNKDAYDKLQKREAAPFANIEKYLEEMAKGEKMDLVWDAQSPDGAYLVSTVNGERSKQKFSNWAQGMIGNNFYEQFRVTGVVENEERFKKMKQAFPTMSDDQIRATIASDVVSELDRGYTKRKSQVDVQIAEIDAILNNLPKKLTPDNQKYVMQLAENKTALIGKKAAIDEEYKYFNTNDKTKIRNYVTTSPDIYFATLAKQRTIDSWATGKASIESKTVKENSAWFNAQNLQMRIKEYDRNVRKDEWEAKIKVLELERDAKGKKDKTTTTTTKDDNTTTTTVPGEDPVSTGRYVGPGTTNILGDKVTALQVFNKHQDDLFLTAHNSVFNTDGILYFAKKGLGLSDMDVANISTALKEEIKSAYDPSAPDYTFTKEQKESSDKLTRLLKESDAVKNAGIDVKGPFSLRNALYAYSKDYLDKKFQASKDGKADPFEDKDEFTAMMNYLVGLQDLDMYNANAENRKKILEDKIFNNPDYKSLVINRNGQKDLLNTADVAKDMPEEMVISHLGNQVKLSKFDLGKMFLEGNLSQTLAGDFTYNGQPYSIISVNGKDPGWGSAAADWNNIYNEKIVPKYGSSQNIAGLHKKALDESIPDLLFYKTRTGQMGTEWSYNFNPKEENDKAFTIFNEALTSSNATIYVTDASGKSEIADTKTQAAIRQLLQDKETNAEKLIQGFRYKTQGVEGRPTIFFSIGDVSAKSEDQVGGVNLNVLNQKSFSLVVSPTADSAPNLASLPSSTGMQIYQQILRGKPFSSDPILSAAGFNFTLTPNDNNNPINVRLSLKYNLAVNEKDPNTGQLVNKMNTVEDKRTLDLTGPNAKTPDEIVNYLYGLFRESMQNNRQKKLEYDAAIKANPGMMTVDRDELFRQLFGDNFVK
jgi:hypothetical protein